MGAMQQATFMQGGGNSAFPSGAWSVESVDANMGNSGAEVTIELSAGGLTTVTRGAGDTGATVKTNWYTPFTLNVGFGYWVRAEQAGDPASSGVFSSRQSLGAPVSWSWNAGPDQERAASLTLFFYDAAVGGTLVGSVICSVSVISNTQL